MVLIFLLFAYCYIISPTSQLRPKIQMFKGIMKMNRLHSGVRKITSSEDDDRFVSKEKCSYRSMQQPHRIYRTLYNETVVFSVVISNCSLYLDGAPYRLLNKSMLPSQYFMEFDPVKSSFYAFSPGVLLTQSSCKKNMSSICIIIHHIEFKARTERLCYRFFGRFAYIAESELVNHTICTDPKWLGNFMSPDYCIYDYVDKPRHRLIEINNVSFHILSAVSMCQLYIDISTSENYQPNKPHWKYLLEFDPEWSNFEPLGYYLVRLQDKFTGIYLPHSHQVTLETKGVTYEARSKGMCYRWRAQVSYDNTTKLVNGSVCVGLKRTPIYTTKNCSRRDSFPYDVYGFFGSLKMNVKLRQQIINCTFHLRLSLMDYGGGYETYLPTTELKFSSDIRSEKQRFLPRNASSQPCAYPYPYGNHRICLNVFSIRYIANESGNMCFMFIGDVTVKTKLDNQRYDFHTFKPNKTFICTIKQLPYHNFPRCIDIGHNEEICVELTSSFREVNDFVSCYQHNISAFHWAHGQNGSTKMLDESEHHIPECCTGDPENERKRSGWLQHYPIFDRK